MASVTIRRLSDHVVSMLNSMAHDRKMSREQMLTNIIMEFTQTDRGQLVTGWIKLDRWGEIDERDEPDDDLAECPECSGNLDVTAAYMAVMGDGTLRGPFCAWCAISE